jgi:DNA-binding transcriptional MocR family regulator
VAELIENGAFDRHVNSLRGEHRRRRDAMVKALRQHVPSGKLRYAIPEGGLYLWCQLPPQVRAKDVQRHAFRDRVVFVPGEAFYVDRGGAHELRVCYSSQPPERAIEAATRHRQRNTRGRAPHH